jgi:hypothetical protein
MATDASQVADPARAAAQQLAGAGLLDVLRQLIVTQGEHDPAAGRTIPTGAVS